MSQKLDRYGIGGSEASAALGLSPWVSPLRLWLNKRAELAGAEPPFPVTESDPIRWGRYLEAPIRQAYCDRFGVEVFTPPGSIFKTDQPWKRATPDGLVLSEGAPMRGLEIKTASHRSTHLWGADGTDEVPTNYTVQCLWSMHVLDLDEWDLAVLIGGADFRCYRLRRDLEVEAEIVERISDFWRRCVEGVEPEIDASEDFKGYLVDRWPGTGDEVEADTGTDLLVAEILTLRARLKTTEQNLALAENRLRATLGNATALRSSYGRVIYRPKAGPARVDWQAIAEHLAGQLDDEPLEPLIETHTKRGRASRPLLYPRSSADAGE